MKNSLETAKPTLLFIANGFSAYGGGNCVMAWALVALRDRWDITISCPEKPDLESINRHFGTDLDESQLTFRTLRFPLNRLNKLDPDPFSVQQLSWLMRDCQKHSDQYDMVMSCDDEMDFGRPGIQYTHFPHMELHKETFEAIDQLTAGQRWRRFLTGRLRPWLLISGIRISRIKRNLFVTNSNWTADVLRKAYGVEPLVVYPPVRWNGPQIAPENRRMAFVGLGRLCHSKRYPETIEIIKKVRARGFNVELDIIGDVDAVAGQPFVNELRGLIAKAGDWARLHVGISRQELENIVSSCRFGIHGMHDEHFGIAPAELMRAGCIVFVPNNGGQVEIVGDNPELKYDSDDDAVEKICRVLQDPSLQDRLGARLGAQADLFGESHFIRQMQTVAEDFAASIQNNGPNTSVK